MNAPLVVFRCDAGPAHGTGHVRRCRALAEAMREAGRRTVFATDLVSPNFVPELADEADGLLLIDTGESVDEQATRLKEIAAGSIQVLVVDHYGLDARFEQACRPMVDILVALDDLADRPRDADLLFDTALGRNGSDYTDLVPQGCSVLTGPDYALLAPQFARMRPASLQRRDRLNLARLMISLGGVDAGPVLERLVDGLAQAEYSGWLTVVLGCDMAVAGRLRERTGDPFTLEVAIAVRDMAERLLVTDLVVGAGGSSAWERCALGVPTLLVVTAHNQDLITKGLARAGAVYLLGWHEEVDANQIAAAMASLTREALLAMGARAAQVCDGEGARRTAQQIITTYQRAT